MIPTVPATYRGSGTVGIIFGAVEDGCEERRLEPCQLGQPPYRVPKSRLAERHRNRDDIPGPVTPPAPDPRRRVTADDQAIGAAANQAGGVGFLGVDVVQVIPAAIEDLDDVDALSDQLGELAPGGVPLIVRMREARMGGDEAVPPVELGLDCPASLVGIEPANVAGKVRVRIRLDRRLGVIDRMQGIWRKLAGSDLHVLERGVGSRC